MSENYQIAVIGTGPGGYIAALRAAEKGASVAVVEKHYLGGVCLNYGCIPSKALLASAELLNRMNSCNSLGISLDGEVSFDWAQVQSRKDRVVMRLRGGVESLLQGRGVKVYNGRAVLDGVGKVNVAGADGSVESFTAEKVIIATGSSPSRIPGWPSDPEYVCTSDEALHWKELPERLLIVGGGAIGCEFACMMAEYGVEVTVVEVLDGLLGGMDMELGKTLETVFKKRKIKLLMGVKVESLDCKGGVVIAIISDGEQIEADKVLVATGRVPNTEGLGLDSLGIETERGFIPVDDGMRTSAAGYYCIGDANGRCLLAHAASGQAEVAVKNALGGDEEFRQPVPNAVYTFPEIASVGMTEKQANEKGIETEVGKFPIAYLGKAMAAGAEVGFVKVVRGKNDDRLLGVHIIGHNATEMIESATAMLSMKASAKELAGMIFAHPTFSEAIKEAAEDSFMAALHLLPKK